MDSGVEIVGVVELQMLLSAAGYPRVIDFAGLEVYTLWIFHFIEDF